MEFVNLLVENVERVEERFLSVLDNLSVEEVNAFPVANTVPSIKSVTWLTWHTARELDFQIADLAKTEPVWFSKGWKKNLPWICQMIRKIGTILLKKRIKLWWQILSCSKGICLMRLRQQLLIYQR